VPAKGIGSGTANLSLSQTIGGLTDKTTYHYRIVATGPGGTTLGQDREFKTLAAAPIVSANSTAVNANDARLQAQIDPNGYAAQYLFQYGTTTSYGQTMPLSAKSAGSGMGPVGVNAVLSGLEPETTYHFRVVAANSQGAALSADGQFTTHWEGAPTLSPAPEFDFDVGDTGPVETQVADPAGVAVDAEGNLWVTGGYEDRVVKFSSQGEYLLQAGSPGTGPGQLSNPGGIAADAEGNVWVADSDNSRIQQFDSEGNFVQQFGSWGTGTGKLSDPTGIAIDPEGDIWVADTGNNRIQEFSSAGSFIRQAGSGELSSPVGLGVDPEGDIWVADTGNNRIQKFGPEGEYLQQVGSEGSEDGEFYGLSGLAVDPQGNVWASDWTAYRLQQFNPAGEYLQQFGEEGVNPGHFNGILAETPNVGIGPEGSIWVADGGGHRVEKWVPGLFGGGP
jgi:sugar lactone lactonase YvrE